MDAFAGRIIVPILDGMSNVVAFGGRIYHGEKDVAKYKNSTNTEIFDKGRTVYGINFVKRETCMALYAWAAFMKRKATLICWWLYTVRLQWLKSGRILIR